MDACVSAKLVGFFAASLLWILPFITFLWQLIGTEERMSISTRIKLLILFQLSLVLVKIERVQATCQSKRKLHWKFYVGNKQCQISGVIQFIYALLRGFPCDKKMIVWIHIMCVVLEWREYTKSRRFLN